MFVENLLLAAISLKLENWLKRASSFRMNFRSLTPAEELSADADEDAES